MRTSWRAMTLPLPAALRPVTFPLFMPLREDAAPLLKPLPEGEDALRFREAPRERACSGSRGMLAAARTLPAGRSCALALLLVLVVVLPRGLRSLPQSAPSPCCLLKAAARR